ncbi:MAG: hypothetical protein ACREAB_01420 [Blastocatellia bacterium]
MIQRLPAFVEALRQNITKNARLLFVAGYDLSQAIYEILESEFKKMEAKWKMKTARTRV